MPLNATVLAMLMKEKLDALPQGTAGEANLQALAEAVVEHIQSEAEVVVQGVQTGGGAATGRIT